MVDYNNFGIKFATSRKNMKWEEVEYFFSQLGSGKHSLLDIGCGSGRLLEQYMAYFKKSPEEYCGIDLSQVLLTEAKKIYPQEYFLQGNMSDASKILKNKSFKNIFCIAAFHHLETLQQRQSTLIDWYKILPKDGKIYMTHWDLMSPANIKKYKGSEVSGSGNEFGSKDFYVKFGEDTRYYHSFSLRELEFLARESGFKILENRLFESQKNIVTILQK